MTATVQAHGAGVRTSLPRVGVTSQGHREAEPVFDNSVGLTVRESEILRLVATGLSNREIAGSIFIGVNTVKTYIRSTYRKLGVESRTQAVVWAFDHELVRPKLGDERFSNSHLHSPQGRIAAAVGA